MTSLGDPRPSNGDQTKFNTHRPSISLQAQKQVQLGFAMGPGVVAPFAARNLAWYLTQDGETRTIGQFNMMHTLRQGDIMRIVNDVAIANSAGTVAGQMLFSVISPSARQSKSGDPSGTMSTAPGAVCYRVFLADGYMFEPTGLADGYGLTDDGFAEMHKAGIARNYEIIGQYNLACVVTSSGTKWYCPGSGPYLWG
jgi:hypothetical protein